MMWIFLTLGGSVAAGLANVLDKLLLRKKHLSDPWTYTFWSGIFGLLAFLFVPFGAISAPLGAALVAFFAGVLFLVGVFFFFQALERSQASVALPVIGGLTPLATYGFSILLLGSALGLGDLIGFVLIVGSAVLFWGIEKRGIRMSSMTPALASAVFFGMSNVLKKMAFNDTSFLPGFIWISLGSGTLALISLVLPRVRKNIRSALRHSDVKNKALYLNNRVLALLGTIGINGAIAFGHPALVEAGQSFKYIIIFLGAWLILREEFSGLVLVRKIIAIFFMLLGFLWLGLVAYAGNIPVDQSRTITWGVTFSDKFSRELGLDWQKNFDAIVEELHPKKMRLIAYWDEIERVRGQYDFSATDWMLEELSGKSVEVIFALGLKVPRWPECHLPDWARALSPDERETVLRSYIKAVITHYRANPNITIWQLENEPFFGFGRGCVTRPDDFLDQELTVVRSTDPFRKTLVTDAGEFGLWFRAARAGDQFGTSMYREVYPPSVGWLTGIIHYPLDPSFFRFKEKIVRLLAGEATKKFIVIELQAEPWGETVLPELSYEEQIKLFSPAYFEDTIRYARDTGFGEYYLWGAEWWYYLREKNSDDRFWEQAKYLFRS